MPLKILCIFLCLVSVHRSLGNGLADADLNIVQSLLNQTGLPSIAETSPDNLNSEYDRNGHDECQKAITLKRTLKLLMSLLSDSSSTNSKTTHVLENLKDLLKNTPAGDAEVIDKIDDLVRTLDKYKEPGDRNDHMALRSLTADPKKDGLYIDSSLKLDLKIPALANVYCTQQLLNILKATEQAYLNLARNPVCDIDVSDLSTIPHINSYLINPNLPIDDWDKSSNTIPNSQNCEKCYPTKPDNNHPEFLDVNPDKNPLLQNYNAHGPGPNYYIDLFDKNPLLQDYAHGPWPNYVRDLFDVKPDKNIFLQDYHAHGPGPEYYLDLFIVKPDKNILVQDYNAHRPGLNYYPNLFDVKPDEHSLLQDYNAHGPEPNYYSDLFDVQPDKTPLVQDYNAHGPRPNNYRDLFDLKPDENLLLQDYHAHGPGPEYHLNFFNVKPDKNLLVQDYNAHSPGPNYYPNHFDVKPDENPLLQDYNSHGPGPNYYSDLFDVKPDKTPLVQDYNADRDLFDVKPDENLLLQDYHAHGPGPEYHLNFFNVKPDKNLFVQDYNAHSPGPNYYPNHFDVKPDENPLLQDNEHGPGTNYYSDLFDVKPDKNPLVQDYNAHGPGPNYYPDLFDVKPDKNPLVQDYNAHGPGPDYYLDLFNVKPDKNLLVQDYNAHGPGLNYYPNLFDVKPDEHSLLQDYNAHGPGPNYYSDLFDVKPDKNPGSNYYYPEIFDVTPEKKPISPDFNPYGPGELFPAKNTVTPYYYPEYVDVNFDKNVYYTPDSKPHGPVNTWDKNPFPYDAAPDTLPLNPIFPYVPKIPSYPNPISENANILPFEITPEAVQFVYPNLYYSLNQSKPLDFYKNVPIYQYPIKGMKPLNPSSIISEHPENNNGVYPHIANAQFQPWNKIPVNAWETSITPDQNQNILDYSIDNQNIQSNYPIEISSFNPNFLPNDISKYNIQSNNQYPSYDPLYPYKQDVSPLNPYSPSVPDQFKSQQPLPNPGPLINVVPKPNEIKPPLQIIELVREAIAEIQAIVPVVKFDRPTLHIIAKIKSILVPKDEDIPHEQYSTILHLFGKLIEHVKQQEYYKQIKDIIDSHTVSNHQKLETEKVVELTYLLKQPKPVVYYPHYYVKYSMPYRNFIFVANNLLRQKPELRDKPKELYEEVLALSNVVDLSPDLKKYNKEDLLKLTVNAGSLVDTKFIEEHDALQEQLNVLKNITSDLRTDEILHLKKSNNKYRQLTDTESDNQASVEPFILRDKKEADPNIIIGMQRLNDIFNTPNFHSSTFNSDKLREDILRGDKDIVNIQPRNAINNRGDNNPPNNNWIQKLSEATKDASHPPHLMSSNGLVRIDNQKITINSGSGNRQDAVSIFNPESTLKLASSNSQDVGIDIESNPSDVNKFLKRYNRPNMINYDNQKISTNSGNSNNQSYIKITNPKLMLNQLSEQESDADDLESTTEQDGLTIESNPPLKWEQLDTTYTSIPRPGSTKNYQINNMAGSSQVEVTIPKLYDGQHLFMPKQSISSYGNNILHYGINKYPHQIEEVNSNEPLLISNNPAANPGSVAYYGMNSMGIPNQAGVIKNEEQLSISNDPTAVPAGALYYGMNSMAANQFGVLGTQNTIIHKEAEQVFPSVGVLGTQNTILHKEAEQVFPSVGVLGTQNTILHKEAEQVFPSVGVLGTQNTILHKEAEQVFPSVGVLGTQNTILHKEAEQVFPSVGVLGTQNTIIHKEAEQVFPSVGVLGTQNTILHKEAEQVFPSVGVLGTQNTILHKEAEQVFPYELEHIVDEPNNNGLNEKSIKESVFDDIQLTEKMKNKGNKSVGGGQGVINNVLQTITGNDNLLQYTVDSQEKLNLNNKLYGADANQEMIEQQNLANNYIAMVGQNNNENYLYDDQHNLGNMGPYSTLGNAQNIQSTTVHHIGAPYSASHNVVGYGQGVDMLGQKLVIQSMPVIYKRPFSYHQRITAKRPVVVG